MKIIKTIGIILILFQSNLFFAQNSLEVEGIYSLSSEKIITGSRRFNFESKLFHSFGVGGKIIFKSNLFIRGGLHFQRFGTKFDSEETTNENPDGTGTYFTTNLIANSIDIPFNFGWYFLNQKKIRLGISIGFNNRHVQNQFQIAKGIKSEITTYNNKIFLVNSSIDLGIKLSEKIFLNIAPIIQSEFSIFQTFDQRGIGCQIGVGYRVIN